MLLTTWFPPRNGVAVNRMQAFVKYLDPARYAITVVTLRQDGQAPEMEELFGAKVYRVENKTVFNRIRERAGEPKIQHNLKVLWNVLLGYARKLEFADWVKRSNNLLEKIHSKNKIQVVISSYSPVEPHLAAYQFCKNHPEVKWIADMRDEMSKNAHLPKKEIRLLTRIEKQLAQQVDAITSVSYPILRDFEKLMPRVKHFEEVRNGYDHDIVPVANFNPVFTMAYAGSFYGKRKPHTFFDALKRFVDKEKCPVRIRFIGVHRNFSIPPEFETSCEFIPHLSNPETIKLLAEADANLLILPPVESKGAYSGKIFDYLSVMKPVIGVLDTTDVAAQLIRELNAGFVADFNSPEEIENAITAAFQLWKEQRPILTDKEKIKMLHRKYGVARLDKLIQKLVAS